MTTNNNSMNPYHQFLRMVWKMRKAQKEYFKWKSQSALNTAKSLETKIDKWIEQCGFEARKIDSPRVCPECDSEINPDKYCMMGHWCGEVATK